MIKADTLFQSTLLASIQTSYRLPDYEDAEIRYDGFFQAKFLSAYLQLPPEQLCVDLFSQKPESLYKRYLLSNEALPYAVVKSFGMHLRPIEMNIIADEPGEDIWLYDTSVSHHPPKKADRYSEFHYLYTNAFYKVRTMIGLRRSITLLLSLFIDKAKMMRNRRQRRRR